MSPESKLVLPDHYEKNLILPQDTRRDFLKTSAGGIAAAVAMMMGGDALAAEEHKDLKKLIDESWDEQNETYDKIATIGIQKYFDGLPNKEEAFFTPEQVEAGHGKCACCSDEGNREYRLPDAEGNMMLIRTPGSGILLVLSRTDKDPFAPAFVDSTAQDAVNTGVTVFTGHKGCGAAKAVFNERINWLKENGKGAEAEKLEQEGPDAFAKRWADTVAARMRQLAPKDTANTIKSDFIERLARPEPIHVARGIDITAIDSLNAAYDSLPQVFVERTGDTTNKDNLNRVLEHANVLRSIAFSPDHGFGEKFSRRPSEKFFMFCIARTHEEMGRIMDRADKARMDMPLRDRERIAIDGFIPDPTMRVSRRNDIKNLLGRQA